MKPLHLLQGLLFCGIKSECGTEFCILVYVVARTSFFNHVPEQAPVGFFTGCFHLCYKLTIIGMVQPAEHKQAIVKFSQLPVDFCLLVVLKKL